MVIKFIRYSLYSLFLFVLALGLISCNNKPQQTETTQPQADTSTTTTTEVQSSSQSELLKLIINPQGGDFRGLKFGATLSEIKAQEKFELFEDSTDHVGFTYETENFEVIDLVYYMDQNKTLISIRIDVYLNDDQSVKNLMDQFDIYFSGKYVSNRKENKGKMWEGSNGVKVYLKDVTKGKDYGLRLGIGPKGSKAILM